MTPLVSAEKSIVRASDGETVSSVPAVSVLMSVYIRERDDDIALHHLRQAIESILNQTFTDFEFLIVSDGSSAASRGVILSYGDARIRLVENETNIGLTKSLNRGLMLARARFVARQDADDISAPERLAKQVAFLEANPAIALVGSWYKEIDAQGAFRHRIRLPADPVDLRWSLLFLCPFAHSAAMLRKDLVLNEVGGYCETYHYAQDHDLWLRIARRLPVTNLPAYLIDYRIHPQSLTTRYGELSDEGVQICAEAIGDLLGWESADTSRNAARFRDIFALLYARQSPLDPDGVSITTKMTWALHEAFCEAYALSPREASARRRKLRSWLSRRHVLIADQWFDRGRRDDARSLMLAACRQHPSTLFRMRTLSLLSKILGFRAPEAAEKL
jgi:glycosyltransferase involved in cell wall biosynthesis